MLVGVLVDVSGSMRYSLQLDVTPSDQHITRAETMLETVINICEREANHYENQDIFVTAFGLDDENTNICDLLSLLEKINSNNKSQFLPTINNDQNNRELLIRLLAEHGAPYARKYVEKHVEVEEASLLYAVLSEDIPALKSVISELPSECKNAAVQFSSENVLFFRSLVTDNKLASMLNIRTSEEVEADATREAANRAIKTAKHVMIKRFTSAESKIKTLKSAVDLLRELIGTESFQSTSTQQSSKSLSKKEKLSQIVNSIEPFIYGNTPMCKALRSSASIFRSSAHNPKVLFVFTDGVATDGDPLSYADSLQSSDVLVFICLLTSENISNPRRLYYEPDSSWTKAQRNMFGLSSIVPNTHPAMSILLENNWELPTSGQSRLFVQANHPDVIDEFSSIVRRLAQSNDALLNIFARVTLDKYINLSNSNFKSPLQENGTCYANAVAAVFHLAMSRIEGREGGVPDFEDVRKKLMDAYGQNGANTKNVLTNWCPKYRLQYKEIIDELGARKVINARRPVVARFSLYDAEWAAFSEYFEKNPKGMEKIGSD